MRYAVMLPLLVTRVLRFLLTMKSCRKGRQSSNDIFWYFWYYIYFLLCFQDTTELRHETENLCSEHAQSPDWMCWQVSQHHFRERERARERERERARERERERGRERGRERESERERQTDRHSAFQSTESVTLVSDINRLNKYANDHKGGVPPTFPCSGGKCRRAPWPSPKNLSTTTRCQWQGDNVDLHIDEYPCWFLGRTSNPTTNDSQSLLVRFPIQEAGIHSKFLLQARLWAMVFRFHQWLAQHHF